MGTAFYCNYLFGKSLTTLPFHSVFYCKSGHFIYIKTLFDFIFRRHASVSSLGTFPDRWKGIKASLILKRTKTQKSKRVLYMMKPLKEELLAWLEKLEQDEQSAPEKHATCRKLFRLPDGLPIAPDAQAS